MTNYEHFVINQTRRQYAPRTLSDAFRGADYGTPIWRCEKPNAPWKYHAMVEAIVLMATMFAVGVLLAPYLS